MTRINTNVSSLVAQKTLARSNSQLQEALARLSTGLRINKGKDDPAGLIASEVLRSDIISVQRAITNSERANQLIGTADSALGQVSSLLNDIRGLVSEAANSGALSADQIAANQLQVDSSLEAIDRIAQTTQFQGRRLLDGSLDFLNTAAGADSAARGTFGTTVDARAVGTFGATLDAVAVGAFGTVTTDARATGTFGAVTTDRRATGSFGTAVDQKAAYNLSAGGAGGSVIRFISQSVGGGGNGFSISITANTSAGVAISFDGAGKTLQIFATNTNTAADIVSALQAHPSAYTALSASVVTSGLVSNAVAGGQTVSGSANNNILLSAVNFGAQFNDAEISLLVTTVATGSETASYNTATNVFTISINTASTTATVISAINAGGVFTGSTTGDGLGTYSTATLATVTTGGSANNQVIFSANTFGPQFNNLNVTLSTSANTGSETASYTTATNTLTIFYHTSSNTSQIVSAVNTNGVFRASTTGAGFGRYAGVASATSVTSGGSAANRIVLSASQVGTRFNNAAVLLNVTSSVSLGTETATYNTAANILTVNLNSGSNTAAAVSAINANGVFRASTTGAGLGSYTNGALANVTSGGSADNRLLLSAAQIGSQYNNTTVIVNTSSPTGSETANYNTATNTLTLSINQDSTAAQVLAAVNANGAFTASLFSGASGLGTYAAGATANVTTGGANNNQIILSATSTGVQFNNTTVAINTGANTGSETASYSTATNTLTLTLNDASTAAQVVSAINTNGVFAASLVSGAAGLGTFAAGTTANVTRSAGVGNISDVKIDQANFGTATQIGITVEIDKQATLATLVYSGGPLTTVLNLEIGGKNGFEVFNFGSGTTTAQIATALNLSSDATGVAASVATNGQLTLISLEYGADAFVSAKAITGTFTSLSTSGAAASRSTGTDIQARINGIQATGKGLRVALNTSSLDISFQVSSALADGGSLEFAITGGGAIFQLGPDVVSNQQARVGIQGVNTATLGGANGKLYELRSGGAKALATDAKGAAKVVDEVISSVTNLRGRLGAFQRTTLETNIFTLNDTLENLSDAESSIRDADFAAESARLTRAQILVQAGTSVLGIANQNPQNVLALLR